MEATLRHGVFRHVSLIALLLFALFSLSSCMGIGEGWEKLEAAKKGKNLVFSGPDNFNPGICGGPFTAQVQDSSGAPVPLTADVTIELSTSSVTGGTTGFYPTNSCAAGISQITIPAGTTTASIYYKEGCTPGTYTLSATAPGYSTATFILTVGGSGC